MIVGILLGAISWFRVYLEFPNEVQAAWTISLSLFCMVLLSAGLGILFSVLLDRLKMDPAAGAVPMLASATDILGICLLVLLSVLLMHDEGNASGSEHSRIMHGKIVPVAG